MLEDEGVAGDVTLAEVCLARADPCAEADDQFKLELIPMEDDLLSMEMDDVARDIYLVRDLLCYSSHQNGDDTPLYYSSLALMTLQRAFGLFPRILGKGDAAKVRAELSHHAPRKASG